MGEQDRVTTDLSLLPSPPPSLPTKKKKKKKQERVGAGGRNGGGGGGGEHRLFKFACGSKGQQGCFRELNYVVPSLSLSLSRTLNTGRSGSTFSEKQSEDTILIFRRMLISEPTSPVP